MPPEGKEWTPETLELLAELLPADEIRVLELVKVKAVGMV